MFFHRDCPVLVDSDRRTGGMELPGILLFDARNRPIGRRRAEETLRESEKDAGI